VEVRTNDRQGQRQASPVEIIDEGGHK